MVVREHLMLIILSLLLQGTAAQDTTKIDSGKYQKTGVSEKTNKNRKVSKPTEEDAANSVNNATAPARFIPYHRVGVSMAHAHIGKTLNADGTRGWQVAGAWGLGYRYVFAKRMSLGVRADLILEEFEVQKQNGDKKVILRTNPFSLNATFSCRILPELSLLLGTGTEYASDQALPSSTIGAEYGWSIPKGYVVGAAITYSIKWNVYDTWFFGFVIAKRFGRGVNVE